MTNSEQAIREFQRKYAMKTYRLNPETLQREQTGYDVNFMIDLTALISEHYYPKEKYDELLQQRDELREALQLLMAGVNRLPPLTGIHGALENQYKIAEAAIKNTEL